MQRRDEKTLQKPSTNATTSHVRGWKQSRWLKVPDVELRPRDERPPRKFERRGIGRDAAPETGSRGAETGRDAERGAWRTAGGWAWTRGSMKAPGAAVLPGAFPQEPRSARPGGSGGGGVRGAPETDAEPPRAKGWPLRLYRAHAVPGHPVKVQSLIQRVWGGA